MATSDFRQRIGSLHNGISTQSASSRFPSQVEDAENAMFSVVSGVSTRAGTRHFAATQAGVGTQYYRAHRIVRDASERYMVIYGRGSSNTIIRIIDLTNPRNRIQWVTGPSSGNFTLSFGGQTTTSLASTASAATVQTALEGLSTVGTGKVTVTRTGSVAPYLYRCVFDDALSTQTVMTASAGSVVGNVISPTFTSTTQTYLDSGSPTADDLRLLTIVDTTIICNTKQATGTRTKTTFTTTHTELDETKFPVQLRRTGLTPPTFEVRFVPSGTDLKNANVDNASWRAPKPFQDQTVISDIAYHRGRLCLAMGENVVCSQPNDIFNFFPFSIATTFAANPADPITVQIGSNTISLIDFMVPFRKSLLLLTRAGTQFELGGDETFTSTNATFVPSTTYATQRVRPVPVSSMIYMAGTTEESSLIYEYVYDDIQVSNRANNITQHVEGLLPSSLRSLVGSDNNDTLVVIPFPTATDPTATITSNGVGGGLWSNPATWAGGKVPTPTNPVVIASGDVVNFDAYATSDGTLFVYRQVRVSDKIVQSAWTRYSFGADIINDAIAVEDTLYVLRGVVISGTLNLVIESMPLTSDPLPPATFVEQPRMDHRHVIRGGTHSGTTSWTLPFEDTSIDTAVYSVGGRWFETAVTVSGTTATAATSTNLSSSLVVLGRKIPFRLVLTRLYQQDGNGNPIIEGELEVNKVVTDHFKSGPYKITASSSNRPDRAAMFTLPSTKDFDQQGRFAAWCVGRSNDLTIAIENVDTRPTILTGIEYYGRHTSMLHGGSS